jgi:hypothetical protein
MIVAILGNRARYSLGRKSPYLKMIYNKKGISQEMPKSNGAMPRVSERLRNEAEA